MKNRTITFIAILLITLAGSCVQNGEGRIESEHLVNLRAVSLRAMQKIAADLKPGEQLPAGFLGFYGITRIHGYISDKEHKDIILYGSVDKTLPALNFGDFIIALRNAWYRYAPRENNVVTYTHPSCSIDPDSTVTKELQALFNDSRKFEEQRGLWDEICMNPQKVSVWGVPFNSNFARVMVEADYYMKRLVDGSVNLNIPGFTSLMDTALSIMKQQIKNNLQTTLPVSPINRFWFYPGRIELIKSDSDILLHQVPVILLTEIETPNKNGKTSGTGFANPLAKGFANSFSDHYKKIALRKKIFAELEELFRFVAIAKAMKYNESKNREDFTGCCQTLSGLDLTYFLHDFPIPTADVKSTLPGIPNLKQFTYENAKNNEVTTKYLWLPSCGGVSIDINLTNDSFLDVTKQDIESMSHEFNDIIEIRIKTIDSKPNAPWWDIENKIGNIKTGNEKNNAA